MNESNVDRRLGPGQFFGQHCKYIWAERHNEHRYPLHVLGKIGCHSLLMPCNLHHS